MNALTSLWNRQDHRDRQTICGPMSSAHRRVSRPLLGIILAAAALVTQSPAGADEPPPSPAATPLFTEPVPDTTPEPLLSGSARRKLEKEQQLNALMRQVQQFVQRRPAQPVTPPIATDPPPMLPMAVEPPPVVDPKPIIAAQPTRDPNATQPPLALQSGAGEIGKLVDGPVDRLGLADNLFAMQEFSMALEIYSQLDVSTLKEDDRQWTVYQMATIHRHLGNDGEAEHGYRKLAGETEATWLVQLSRWWLDHLQRRRTLATDHAKHQSQLQTLQKVMQAHE